MSEKLYALALERQRLLARSATLRARLASELDGLSPVFAVADTLRDGAGFVRRHPEWVVGTAVLLLVARPKLVWRWGRRAFVGWRLWRSMQDLLERNPAPRGNRL